MKQYDEIILQIMNLLKKYNVSELEMIYILTKMLGTRDKYS